MELVEITKVVGVVLGPVLGGGGVWAFLAARQKAKPSILASQADFGSMLNEQTQILLRENAKDRRDLKRVVTRQGVELKRLGAAVAECNTKHQECETRVANLKSTIDQLMADNPPASY